VFEVYADSLRLKSDVRRLSTSPVKALVKTTSLTAFLALIAYSRIAYVQHFKVHSKEGALGEALDPINGLALLSFFGFGTLTVILLCACLICAVIHFWHRHQLATHSTARN
jgi:hypothetical protein